MCSQISQFTIKKEGILMFEDFLVSSDTAAVLSFIAFLILLFIGSNNKNIGIFHSVFNVYQYLKTEK